MRSPPGTSPTPVRPALSRRMTTLRVNNGPCAPLKLSSMLSSPATGIISMSETTGVPLPRSIMDEFYSATIFSASVTFFQRCVSSARKMTNCVPLLATTSKPMSLNDFVPSAELMAAAISISSFARTSDGNPLGAAALPEVDDNIGNARFGGCRNIRQGCGTLLTGNRQYFQLTGRPNPKETLSRAADRLAFDIGVGNSDHICRYISDSGPERLPSGNRPTPRHNRHRSLTSRGRTPIRLRHVCSEGMAGPHCAHCNARPAPFHQGL